MEIKIIFSDATYEATTINLSVLAAVTQIETFKVDQINLSANQFVPLIPALNKELLTYVKMWRGYPFEFTGFSNAVGSYIKVDNVTTGDDLVFVPSTQLTAFYLSDGQNEFLSPQHGWNEIKFQVNDLPILTNKMLLNYESDPECGIYIKFINRFGRWTYWLFSKYVYKKRSSKYMG